jgi:hypothetical protein
MKRHFFKLVTAIALSLLCGAAMAQVSNSLAEKLIRKSGLWAQVETIPAQVQSGVFQSPMKALIPEAQLNRMVKIAGQSFAAARIQKALVSSVVNQMKPAQVEQAIAWYDSPTGQMITALEESTSASFNDVNAALNEGNQALENASVKRQTLITAIIKASRSVSTNVDMAIHTAVAVFRGIVLSQAPKDVDAVRNFQAAMEAQRPQMIASTMGQTMALSALAYATVSDEDLEGYVQFLSGEVASHMLDVLNQGLDRAFTQAGQDFGKQILVKKMKAGV